MKAVVFGATGAVGRELVASLASQSHITKIIAVTRSVPSSPPDTDRWMTEKFPSLTEPSHAQKVEAVELDWESFAAKELSETTTTTEKGSEDSSEGDSGGGVNLFAGAEYVGWALGTTKADAGSANKFERIDFDYCRAAAGAARREESVKHFAVVSSNGAKSNSWFLYLRTKGKIEDFVGGLGFDRVSIYRPGCLDRGDKLRSHEKYLVKVLKSTPVSAVANLMVSHSNDGGECGVKVYKEF